ncbi:MAG: hypothetical protein J6Y09_03000 [Lachnospiraceae bacterium]|nr:hypothetical protein [Lachnospiraceae bacterium]
MDSRTFWLNHVEDQHGQVIQQGTLLDQDHFNNVEVGISDSYLAQQISRFMQIQEDFDTLSEVKSVSLAMNALPWPFNNKENTVALSQLREHTDYSVEVEVVSYSGGRLGNIQVKDRALNGFKLLHDGSATTVNVIVRITGGMIN